MEKVFDEIHQINSALRLLHLQILEEVKSINEEECKEIEYQFSHTANVANNIINYAKEVIKLKLKERDI